VKRISLGPRLSNHAFAAIERAAREILDKGTFGFNADIMPSSRIAEIMSGKVV
jgi:2-methylisocitrate lyase-like PEP mutase family enzyme